MASMKRDRTSDLEKAKGSKANTNTVSHLNWSCMCITLTSCYLICMLQLLQVATMFAADPHPFNINHLEAFYTYHFLVSIYNILNQIHTYIYIYIYL